MIWGYPYFRKHPYRQIIHDVSTADRAYDGRRTQVPAVEVIAKELNDLKGGMPCEPRKSPYYFPLYWLVNRDPGSL